MSVDKFKFVCINSCIEDDAGIKRIDNEISTLIEQGSRHFVFALNDINYLDSAAAGIFINTLCYVQKENGSLFIIARDEKTRKVLAMTGFHHFIKIFGSKDEFLADAGGMC
ncbi:MAG: STAS domain-containing protein [Chitinispirillales bacterium]|jgi:anti-anti-sigma factor|nr:STAS domain-containing protein [Chitinispirillales bacterium]